MSHIDALGYVQSYNGIQAVSQADNSEHIVSRGPPRGPGISPRIAGRSWLRIGGKRLWQFVTPQKTIVRRHPTEEAVLRYRDMLAVPSPAASRTPQAIDQEGFPRTAEAISLFVRFPRVPGLRCSHDKSEWF